MLVAVTNRVDLQVALRTACTAAPLHGARPVTLHVFSDVGETADLPSVAVLVLDLGFCASDKELCRLITVWRRIHPSARLVLLRTMVDKEAEGTLLMNIAQAAAWTGRDVTLKGDQVLSVQRWVEILIAHPINSMLADVRHKVENSLPVETPNRSLLLQMMALSSTYSSSAKCIAGHLSAGVADEATTRQRINRQLRRERQPPMSVFLLAFRLLVHARLLELAKVDPRYWTPARRAEALSMPNHRALKRSFRNKVGIDYKAIAGVDYQTATNLVTFLAKPIVNGHTRRVKTLM